MSCNNCNCNNPCDCGCKITTTTTCAPIQPPVCVDLCDEVLLTDCIIYEGDDLPCYGIKKGDDLKTIFSIIFDKLNIDDCSCTFVSPIAVVNYPTTTTSTSTSTSTSTTSSTSSTTTTTTIILECECFTLENTSNNTQSFSYIGCNGFSYTENLSEGETYYYCAKPGTIVVSPSVIVTPSGVSCSDSNDCRPTITTTTTTDPSITTTTTMYDPCISTTTSTTTLNLGSLCFNLAGEGRYATCLENNQTIFNSGITNGKTSYTFNYTGYNLLIKWSITNDRWEIFETSYLASPFAYLESSSNYPIGPLDSLDFANPSSLYWTTIPSGVYNAFGVTEIYVVTRIECPQEVCLTIQKSTGTQDVTFKSYYDTLDLVNPQSGTNPYYISCPSTEGYSIKWNSFTNSYELYFGTSKIAFANAFNIETITTLNWVVFPAWTSEFLSIQSIVGPCTTTSTTSTTTTPPSTTTTSSTTSTTSSTTTTTSTSSSTTTTTTVAPPPTCECYLVENTGGASASFTYIACNGNVFTNVTLTGFDAVSICAVTDSVTPLDPEILIIPSGTSCVDNVECIG